MKIEIVIDMMRIISSEHIEYKDCIKELISIVFRLGYGLDGEFSYLTKHLTEEDKVELVTQLFKLGDSSLKQAIYILFNFEHALNSSDSKRILFNRIMVKLMEVDRKFNEFQDEFLLFLDSKAKEVIRKS